NILMKIIIHYPLCLDKFIYFINQDFQTMRKSFILLYFTLTFLINVTCLISTKAQSFIPTALKVDNQVIRGITTEVNPAGWLYFKESARIPEYYLFSDLKTAMGLTEDDEMILTRTHIDEYGYTHNRYQQYYKNVRVEGAEYDEHILKCIVRYAHGKLLEQPQGRNVVPVFDEQEALYEAMNYIG